MSHLLEIKTGLFVRANNIEAIEYQDSNATKIYTNGGVFDSDIPIATLRSLLEMHFDKMHESSLGEMGEIADNTRILRNNSQFFGG
jgi:hypothetical protein